MRNELKDARRDWAVQQKKLKEETIEAFLKSPEFDAHCVYELMH